MQYLTCWYLFKKKNSDTKKKQKTCGTWRSLDMYDLLFSVCKSVFAYSRLWGGWAAEEAETVGWTPPGSVSSPSTASWTDPSWLRPLASWMTRGSGSDRSRVGRIRCERSKPDHSNHPPLEEGGQLSPGSAAVAVRFHAHTGTSEVSAWTSLVSKSWLIRVRLSCHALHPRALSSSSFCRPSCSSLGI